MILNIIPSDSTDRESIVYVLVYIGSIFKCMDGEIVGISKNARYLMKNQLKGILEMPTNFTKSTHLIHYRLVL